MADTETQEAPRTLSLPVLAKQIKELQAQIDSFSTSTLPTDTTDIQSQLEDLRLRLAALGARNAPADVVLNNAARSLEKIEAEKRSGGKYRWLIEKPWYASRARKGQEGKVPAHEFWSDATTEKGVLEDFKRRAGVQHDTSDRRGEPFRAVKVDPELVKEPPTLH